MVCYYLEGTGDHSLAGHNAGQNSHDKTWVKHSGRNREEEGIGICAGHNAYVCPLSDILFERHERKYSPDFPERLTDMRRHG